MNSDEKCWGIRINRITENFGKKSAISRGYPTWVTKTDLDHWESKGVVLWNNETRKMELLTGLEALGLLNKLMNTTQWKVDGVLITRPVYQIYLELPNKSLNKGKNEIQEQEIDIHKSLTNQGWIDEPILNLSAEVGDDLIKFLQMHEKELNQMAEQEIKNAKNILARAYKYLLDLPKP